MGLFSNRMNRRNSYGYQQPQQDIFSEILEVEAIEDLAQGDVGGFVEDEMLASIF
jgi:hypothetical protein